MVCVCGWEWFNGFVGEEDEPNYLAPSVDGSPCILWLIL